MQRLLALVRDFFQPPNPIVTAFDWAVGVADDYICNAGMVTLAF